MSSAEGLLYCSTLWRPYLLKNIESLEKIQQRITKFILSNYHSDYGSSVEYCRYCSYTYEITDILFFIKSIKHPSDKFDILNYANFTTDTTRSAGTKLYPKTAHTNPIMNSYFYRLPMQIEFPTNH